MSAGEPRLVEIGRVARPHGVRGELRISLHWPGSRTLFEVESVVLLGSDGARTEQRLEGVRATHGAVLVMLAGVHDRDAAARFRGARVAVPRDALPPLAPGEYYLVNLVGARVLAPGAGGELAVVGEVTAVRQLPSVNVMVVRTADGVEHEQPLAGGAVREIDAASGRVVLADTEGWV